MYLNNEVELLSSEIYAVMEPYMLPEEDYNYYLMKQELEKLLENWIPDLLDDFLYEIKEELKIENFI